MMAKDTHYKYLLVFLVPVTLYAVIINWWGLKVGPGYLLSSLCGSDKSHPRYRSFDTRDRLGKPLWGLRRIAASFRDPHPSHQATDWTYS